MRTAHAAIVALLLGLPGPAGAAEPDPAADLVEATPDAETAGETSEPRTWRVVPDRSALWVTVWKDRSALASGFAHDHAIAATDYTGRVVWDLTDPGRCEIHFDVPVRSLRPDPPGYRERAGIDPDDTVGASARQSIVQNMLGPDQLDADNHPVITFRSTSCSGVEGEVQVQGDLTIRGVTQRITAPVHVEVDDGILTARGGFEVLHGDFGMAPYRNAGGLVRNAEKLTFGLDLKAVPAE